MSHRQRYRRPRAGAPDRRILSDLQLPLGGHLPSRLGSIVLIAPGGPSLTFPRDSTQTFQRALRNILASIADAPEACPCGHRRPGIHQQRQKATVARRSIVPRQSHSDIPSTNLGYLGMPRPPPLDPSRHTIAVYVNRRRPPPACELRFLGDTKACRLIGRFITPFCTCTSTPLSAPTMFQTPSATCSGNETERPHQPDTLHQPLRRSRRRHVYLQLQSAQNEPTLVTPSSRRLLAVKAPLIVATRLGRVEEFAG